MTSAAAPRIPIDHCGCCGAAGAEPAGHAQDLAILRCTRCRTLRFESVADPELVYADGYHSGDHEFGWNYKKVVQDGYEQALSSDRLDLLERYRRPGTLIDVGGGLGGFSAAARARGWDAELLEPVGAAVAAAREAGVPAHQGGAEALATLGRTYDVVTYIHCIEHVPEAAAALEQTRDAIASGGLLFVEVPNYGSMARRLQGDTWLGYQAGEHVYLFERHSIVGLVERAGYEVHEVRTTVPGWHGMFADGYAHMLGLQPTLAATARLKQRVAALVGRGRAGAGGGAGAAGADEPPQQVPINEDPGPQQLIFTKGFDALARLEERSGTGTNLQVIARPRR